MDAIDVAIVDFNIFPFQLIGTYQETIPKALKNDLKRLCSPSFDEIYLLGVTDARLGECIATVILNALNHHGIPSKSIRAIGSHGQTIRHMPWTSPAFTIQIGDPHMIAARTNISVVADFRRRDMALGGQGAPLSPVFHAHFFSSHKEDRCIVNIGGIANATFLPHQIKKPISGFDVGPGNTLLDHWAHAQLGVPCDYEGQWAKTGRVHDELLNCLLKDPFFTLGPIKSTGLEYFNLDWLGNYLRHFPPLPGENIQATLVDLTAQTIANQIHHFKPSGVWCCGGGVHNTYLMGRLQHFCAPIPIHTTRHLGLDPDWVEAVVFAWLAKQTLSQQPSNLPSVTGARTASVLGCIIP